MPTGNTKSHIIQVAQGYMCWHHDRWHDVTYGVLTGSTKLHIMQVAQAYMEDVDSSVMYLLWSWVRNGVEKQWYFKTKMK